MTRLFSHKIFGVSLLLAMMSPTAWAGKEPIRLSLKETLTMAKARHVDVLLASERVQQAISKISQERSELFPHLSGAVSQYRQTVNLKSIGINPNIPGFNPNVPPFNVFDARITLKQTLFDLAVLRRLSAAKTGQLLSNAERQKAEEDAMALVANMYLEAQRADEAVAYAEALRFRDEANLGLARNRKQLGLGSAFELTQAESELAQTKHQVDAAKANREEKRLDLAAALGLPEDQPIIYTSHETLLKDSLPAEDEIRTRVSFHPDIEVAQQQVTVSQQDRRVEVAQYYPSISASANYGPNGPHPGDVDDTYSYGGKLSIPIYEGGLRKARVQEATSKVRAGKVQLTQTEKDKLSQALSALESLRQTVTGINAAKANLAEHAKNFSLTQHRLSTGIGAKVDVVIAQAELAQSKDLNSEAIATYRLAWVNLIHSMGNMGHWIEEMKEP